MNHLTFQSIRGPSLMLAASLTALLTGCAGNLTGLAGARDDFACPMSGGVNCTTVSATYEQLHAESDKKPMTLSDAPKPRVPEAAVSPEPTTTTSDSGLRIRTEPLRAEQATRRQNAVPAAPPGRAPERVVMLWVLPWVDTDGDLHSQSRVWMRVRDALWRIESVRRRAMRAQPEIEP